MLAAAAAACEDKKAEDIRILGLTDYFLICSGNSDRQNVAITDEIEIRLKRDFGTYPTSVEGRRQGEWVLMDYVDFIVHVFSAEKRAYYGLERLRKTATVLSIDDLNAEIKSAITATRSKKSTTKSAAKKAVPTKTSAKKPTSRKAPAKKSLGTKDAAKAASRNAIKDAPVKAATAKKAPATKAPATAAKKSAPAKKAVKKAAKKAPAKR
jgi:ribosome-associated protein